MSRVTQNVSPPIEAIAQISLDGEKPLFTTNERGLPVFLGETFEEHVETFEAIDKSIDARKWALAAIAASVKTKYDEQTIINFAHRTRHSAVYIYELANTYRKFENSPRGEILSFTHHKIAAHSKNPQKAIKVAEDEEMSTRELEQWVKRQKPPTRKPVPELLTLHQPAVIEHLEGTIEVLKARDDAVPAVAPFLHNMYHAMIGQVQWQLGRTEEEDAERILEAAEEGNYRKDDIFKWLQDRGYFMREPELCDRLQVLALHSILETEAIEQKLPAHRLSCICSEFNKRLRATKEGGKKDTQRGDMVTIYVPYYTGSGDDFHVVRSHSVYENEDGEEL